MRSFNLLLLICFLTINVHGQEELDLLGRWMDTTLVASNAHDNIYNEIWGLAINGSEYAVIGTTYGTHFIDVTDPGNPQEVIRVPGKAQGRGIVHRDYHDHEGFLYAVCDEGASSLQIMDIRQLPESVEVIYDSDSLIQRSHNIFIDTSRSRLFSLATRGTSTGTSPMSILDISQPDQPKYLGGFRQFGDIRPSHVHDAFIQNDTAFLNCGYSGFAIVDFSDIENPVALATLNPSEYPDAGYNHSGWLSAGGTHYYMADENHGYDIKVLSLEDINNVETVGTFNAGSTSLQSIAHNPLVACDLLYVAYYYDGLQVYDISDPANPVRSSYYPTSILDNDSRYKGAWGVYPFLPSGTILVSDMQRGLFVVEAVDPTCQTGITTSIDIAPTEANLQVVPNPVTTSLEIRGLSAEKSFVILDTHGKVIETSQGGTQLDISSWPSGLYIIRAENAALRFIKN